LNAFFSRERGRFLRFSVVGTIGAVVDFGVFNLLIELLYVAPIRANVVSFGAAVVSNFFWNRHWTYPDSRTKKVPRQLLEFFAINLVGVLIRTPIFALLENPLILAFNRLNLNLPIGNESLGHNFALGSAMILVLFWNFFANRFWTYGDI